METIRFYAYSTKSGADAQWEFESRARAGKRPVANAARAGKRTPD
jgi:hypothetical protein